MGDFASQILRKYGTPAVLFAIIVAAAVWLLAHIAAAPGGDVTVLWGLVKYTKKTEIHGSMTTLPQKAKRISPTFSPIETRQKETLLPPLSLLIRHNISSDNFTTIISELRKELILRELSVSESGKKISETPNGTFFFTLGAWLESEIKLEDGIQVDDFLSPFTRFETKRIRPSESYVEIQYPRNGDYNLILFVDEQTASQIAQLNGNSVHQLMAAVYPWGEMHSLISLPVGRIIKSKDRDIQVAQRETVTVLDLMIR